MMIASRLQLSHSHAKGTVMMMKNCRFHYLTFKPTALVIVDISLSKVTQQHASQACQQLSDEALSLRYFSISIFYM